MTNKDYFSQVFILDRLVKARQEQIAELRAIQTGAGHSAIGVKVQSSSAVRDKMADLSARIMDMIAESENDILKLLDVKSEIKRSIGRLENPLYRLILEERYINLKRWEDIAADNNYSWQWIHKLHKKALAKVAIKSEAIL